MSGSVSRGQSGKVLVKLIPLILLITITGLISCSGQEHTVVPPADQTTMQPADPSIEVLREIQEAPVPAGITPQLWAELTTELARVIEAESRAAQNGGPLVKQATDAPIRDSSTTRLNWNDHQDTLSWGYACTGDYDQNGEVNIADLTSLGRHFGWSSGGSAYPWSIIEAVVDGDLNGEINIGDVTPIGQNFKRMVTGYNIYQSLNVDDFPAANDEPSSLAPLGSIDLSGAVGEITSERLFFFYVVNSPVSNAYYWVRPTDGSHEGTPSNVINIGSLNEDPSASLAASPDSGPAALEVSFDASASSDTDGTIDKYEYDFDEGDGWVDNGTSPTVTHTYDTEGSYQAQVRVTDNTGGTATASFGISIGAGYPVIVAESGALIAVPAKNEINVDEPVMIRVVSGITPNLLRDMRGVRIVIPGSPDYIPVSIDLGAPDGNPEPDRPLNDGLWEDVGSSGYLIPGDGMLGFNYDDMGLYAFDYAIIPQPGGSATNDGGDLFNFLITFPAAGVYQLRFVEVDGVKRTFYGHSLEEHFWPDTSNDAPGYDNTIYVGYPKYTPGPDTLIAVPSANTVTVGENLTLRVITGTPANPIKFANGVRIIIDGPVEYDSFSFDTGCPDNESAEIPIDGLWVGVAPTGFILPMDSLHDAINLGGGQWAFDGNVTPIGGNAVTGVDGELFNFRFSFTQPGEYTISMVESFGGIDRTHYEDGVGGKHFWSNISNVSTQFSRTVTVTN